MSSAAPVLGELEEFKRRCLADTGFFGRHVLGYDYDESDDIDPATGKGARTPGGIRDHGPHAAMVAAIDRPDSMPVLCLMPRSSYKSTILQTYAIRVVVRDPTIRVLYGMDTYDKAKQKLAGIKSTFDANPKLIELFGDLRGEPWEKNKFSLDGHRPGQQEYTFQGFGPDKPATGGHYEVIILDDLINHENCRTPEGVEKVMRCFRQVSPLLVPGGKLIVVGTRYFDGDLYEYIITRLAGHYRILTIDCGMEPQDDPDTGVKKLVGKPTFAHLTEKYLAKKLLEMEYQEFCSQYCNKVVTGLHQTFERHHFRPLRWDPDAMATFTGYLFTDTAVSTQKEACRSVIAYVLFDQDNVAYLADLRVGHFPVPVFVNHFFDVLMTWQTRCYHVGECWERIALNETFRVIITDRAKALGQRVQPIDLPRTGIAAQKEGRIRRLEPRFVQGRFYVLDTVPRTFTDIAEQKSLWEPEGHLTDDGLRLPAGELVTEFIRFPKYPTNDICDALADIDSMNPDGSRIVGYCTPRSYVIHRKRWGDKRAPKWKAGQVLKDRGAYGVDVPQEASSDWVDQLYRDHREGKV